MKPIADLVKKHGTQKKLADAMGSTQSMISKWVHKGALVDSKGNVWTIAATHPITK